MAFSNKKVLDQESSDNFRTKTMKSIRPRKFKEFTHRKDQNIWEPEDLIKKSWPNKSERISVQKIREIFDPESPKSSETEKINKISA